MVHLRAHVRRSLLLLFVAGLWSVLCAWSPAASTTTRGVASASAGAAAGSGPVTRVSESVASIERDEADDIGDAEIVGGLASIAPTTIVLLARASDAPITRLRIGALARGPPRVRV